ncbi:MAG TPA: hypothetical protein VIV66_12975 [Pyrinomonadaceae bacterium]
MAASRCLDPDAEDVALLFGCVEFRERCICAKGNEAFFEGVAAGLTSMESTKTASHDTQWTLRVFLKKLLLNDIP